MDIYMDIQGAMYIPNNPVTNKRSKHIYVHYHMIRNYNNKGTINPNYISTEYNTPDIMTKARTRKTQVLHEQAFPGQGDRTILNSHENQ